MNNTDHLSVDDVKFDCKHFKGAIPCTPNKLRGKVCQKCDEYQPITKRILMIKLGALGDVIRTTPLLTRFRQEYPGCHITWITLSPDILPKSEIDELYAFDFKSTYIIRHQHYDIAINLDKEFEACSLLQDVSADTKMGYILSGHHIDLANPAAKHKFMTGLFDQYSQENTKDYLTEIFEICELDFKGEEYILPVNPQYVEKWKTIKSLAEGKPIVGLNTGCGKRWPTRMWPKEKWLVLIKALQSKGYFPIVLGGPDEHETNLFYHEQTGAYYPDLHPLQEFIAITAQCDLVVSAVSMMMHIAIGLKKPLILFNNIFNKHEFLLYGRGEIVEPPTGCDCYYGSTCTRHQHCMDDLTVDSVLQGVEKHIPS